MMNEPDVFGTYEILVKFMFSKKATKIDEIFTVDLTVTTLEFLIDVG